MERSAYAPSLIPAAHDLSFERIQRENTEIQKKQMELLQKMTLPVPKPPVFDGNTLDFPTWESAFDALIDEDGVNPRHQLYYLGEYTSGTAKAMISGLLGLRTKDAYKRARKILKERFGDPFRIYEAYREKLKNWPVCTTSSDLQNYSDFLVMTQETMKTVRYLKEFDSFSAIRELAARFPSHYCNKWRESAKKVQEMKGDYLFSDLVSFAQDASVDANHPVFSYDALTITRRELENNRRDSNPKRKEVKTDKNHARSTTFSTAITESCEDKKPRQPQTPSTKSACVLCTEDHTLEKCKEFLAKPVKNREEFCKSKGLCFSCLGRGHVIRQCKKKRKCEVCGKSHATVLHRMTEEKENAQEELVKATNNCVKCEETTTSMILPVTVHHENRPEHKVKIYAILDDQSDTCFISDQVKNELEVSGPNVDLELGTMHSVENVKVQRITGLVVSQLDGELEIDLPKVYSRNQIPGRRSQIPRPETAAMYKHLESLKDKIPPLDKSLPIGLLIGNDCVRAIKPRDVIPGNPNDPYAVRTVLGWGIVGAVTRDEHSDEANDRAACLRIATKELGSDTPSVNFVQDVKCKEIMTPLAINKMFEQDFSEACESSKPYSQEDMRFMKITKDGIHQTADQHYEMPLPLREDHLELPYNRPVAQVRLGQLKKRFVRNPRYAADYVAFMEETIAKGYAVKLEDEPKNAWFLCHHGVYHPKKPGKIRVVFNCSEKYRGESLNEHLLQGPDMTNSMIGVLCRFRQERVAFACDIEGMFNQVRVNEEHRAFLCFLWWDQGDVTKEPSVYQMKVHLFGATSSPGCANLALRQTAEDNKDELGEEAAEFIRRNFYVDDGLKSVESTEKATAIIKNATEMCKRGGFRLHKFASNSKAVLKTIPKEDQAKEVKSLELDSDPLPPERVLGVEWCVQNDTLQFRITLQDKPLTRRGILSTVSSVYDPLGLAAPFLLKGKRVLQMLCKENITWDDPIPEQYQMQWERWRSELPHLEQLEVPRCFQSHDQKRLKKTELHHFSDASIDGYGQCSYLRLVDEDDQINCTLVMGKARVAPLKPITIPRLELAAAVVSVRVSEQLRRELEYEELEEVFWTDSQVVRAYISNDARRFHTFVANRVQQIRERTQPTQWKHVDGHQNPADDASRGLSPKNLGKTSRWIQGPEFLWTHHDSWENFGESEEPLALSTEDKEVRKTTTLTSSSHESFPDLLERLKYFSDWFRAKRAVANCIRYIRKLRSRLSGERHRPHDSTTVEDLHEAEELIVRQVQKRAFPEELKQLRTKKEVIKGQRHRVIKGTSPLQRLDPFIDQGGLLRVGGRIQQASLDKRVKHPVILPKDAHVTRLIARNYHECTGHQGRGMTLNEIRSSGFWIVGCSSVVSKLIHKCATCRKFRTAVQEQKMADLPGDRLSPAPPFTYCGVDYFGPWYVKQGRSEVKRYGVLFTCLTVRAVHIEVANTLETDAYINALRRFICRRGPVRQMRSDQGSNLVGAKNELRDALNEMDHNKIKTEMLKTNCDWFVVKLNPPSASHRGGAWERQIRTVRSVLNSLLQKNGKQLNDEALRTLMCEVEAVVNSRPLTADTTTSADGPEPLTPSHFLTMKSKVVMPPPGVFQSEDLYSRKWWRRVQHLTNEFWSRWRKEFLHSLQERQKWTRPRRNLQTDDLVLIKDDNVSRNQWKMARVINAVPDNDGLVRRATVLVGTRDLTARGKRTTPQSTLERPVQKLVLLVPATPRPGIPVEEPTH